MKSEYNTAPEGLKEISLQEWQRGMFQYNISIGGGRHVSDKELKQFFDLRLFSVPNFEDKQLGYAIMDDWFNSETGKRRPEAIVRFCRYGTAENWESFERRFAAQFAGDNS